MVNAEMSNNLSVLSNKKSRIEMSSEYIQHDLDKK